MKTKILVLALILGTAVAASAQKVSFGPKVGVNMSHFWGETPKDFNHVKIGGNGGLFITYSTDAAIGFSAEVLYSQKGSRYEMTGPLGERMEGRYRVDYIELPFDVRFFLAKAGKVRPHISLGPTMSFNVVATDNQDDPMDRNVNIKNNIKTFDFGAHVGTGVNIAVGKIWINPELRYTLGFVNVPDGGAYDFKNGVLSAGVGIGFVRAKRLANE